jgi:hypothetical protein
VSAAQDTPAGKAVRFDLMTGADLFESYIAGGSIYINPAHVVAVSEHIMPGVACLHTTRGDAFVLSSPRRAAEALGWTWIEETP